MRRCKALIYRVFATSPLCMRIGKGVTGETSASRLSGAFIVSKLLRRKDGRVMDVCRGHKRTRKCHPVRRLDKVGSTKLNGGRSTVLPVRG